MFPSSLIMGSPVIFCRLSDLLQISCLLFRDFRDTTYICSWINSHNLHWPLKLLLPPHSRLPSTALTSALRVLPLAQKLPPTGTAEPQVHLGSCWSPHVKPCCLPPSLEVDLLLSCCAFYMAIFCYGLAPCCTGSLLPFTESRSRTDFYSCVTLLPSSPSSMAYASDIAHRDSLMCQTALNVDMSPRGQRTNSSAQTWVPLHAKDWYIVIEHIYLYSPFS